MWRDLAQPSHLIILAVLIVILFGWKKLPDAARSVGRSMRIFKSEMGEMKNDGKEAKPSPAATETVPGQVAPSATTPAAAQAPPAAASPTVAPPVQPVPPVHDLGADPTAPQPHDTTAR